MMNLGNLLKVIACVQAFFFIYWIVISTSNNDTMTNYVNVSKYVDIPNYINITRYVDIPKYINITKEIHVNITNYINITNYVNVTRYVDTPKYTNTSNYVNITVEYPNYVNMPIKQNNTYPATVVSAYFPLESAKHSQEQYNAWMQNFFQIEAPLVLFTSTKMVDQIRKLRDRKLPTTIITDYSSPFDYGVNAVLKDIYNGKQHDKDPEKGIHNGFLYAIWNGKSSLVDRVSRENIYNSTYFFWVDTGCFRSPHNYRMWPDTGRLSHIWDKAATLLNQEKSEILLLGNVGGVGAIFKERAKWGSFIESPLAGDAIIGTFFGGPAPAVQWWAKAFYSALSSYVSKDYFVGKDQSIMNSISIQHESKIVTLDSSGFTCGDQWFFFQPFLAHESEYNKTHSENCHQENLLKRVRDT